MTDSQNNANGGLAAAVTLGEDRQHELQTFFTEFLERDYGENKYKHELQKLVKGGQGGGRLIVNLDDLREYDREQEQMLVNNPAEYVPAFENAATEIANNLISQQPGYHSTGSIDTFKVNVGFVGSFGSHHITPRGLRAALLGHLVCIEGIVTRCSLVRPKVVRSIHYSEKKDMFYSKTYRDQTTLNGSGGPVGQLSSAYPTQDDDGNPLSTEFGFSQYADHQTINVQEMPERAPPGQLPRGVDIILDADLVDSVKPGDRVLVVGIFRALAGKAASATTSIFRTVVLANTIRIFGASSLAAESGSASMTVASRAAKASELNADANSSGLIGAIKLTDGDIRHIMQIAQRKDHFELLSQSLAPSICGHSEIKRALLLLLLGGCEKNLENGTHIRGDINMLMVGDPSTAKSQLLRYILRIAPLAIATTGRGSSGVGLTAAVTTDKDTGERRLEAGAMVLADRGVVCIDEFDKMTDMDRVAIHEVMEQQTVTIAKAGIHTTLNARCSVVAAANPVYGRYDLTRPPHQNIALPDSLLSRFDLLFVVTDSINEARDRMISEHVLRMHRYVPPGIEPGQPTDDILDTTLASLVLDGSEGANGDDGNDAANEERDCPVFEPFNEFLHAGVAMQRARTRRGHRNRHRLLHSQPDGDTADEEDRREILSTAFLKRYIFYAKSLIKPVLTPEAADEIANAYADLRGQINGSSGDPSRPGYSTAPITARTLETLIRLATANAKARLSSKVESEDAEIARKLLRFALFKEPVGNKAAPKPGRKERKRMRQQEPTEDSSDEDEDINNIAENTGLASTLSSGTTQRSSRISARSANPNASVSASGPFSDPVAGASASQPTTATTPSSGAAELTSQRYDLFKSQLSKALTEGRLNGSDGILANDQMLPAINHQVPDGIEFSFPELEAGLKKMEDENRVMYRDGIVFII
ncbi:MCM DNA helicase complex subunit [Mycoemilia scoparia]|uniref:DNA replication licensing factor MCM3 n=1 Tax=Mycoemilia scoparia TaxID=417184 RepID=A0A9W8DUS2_9FUNG|nr:MCM DNA helicase complex subunit [Mycoemilia scoparia]